MATILEHFKIPPTADSMPSEFSLPLVFFDFISYEIPEASSVLFFEFPCSKSYFLNTVVPDLKTSLSLTLGHFLPFSSNIIHPLTPGHKPILRYQAGDSVSLTISESSADFNNLIGNDPRVCNDFYPFAPNLPPATHSENSIACPVLALQVTIFPEQGLCIGFVHNHAIADANTIVSFIQAWSLVNTNLSNGAEFIRDQLRQENHLPFFNRETLINQDELFSIYWAKKVESSAKPEPKAVKVPAEMVRATFVLKKEEIQKLKEFILAKSVAPNEVSHLSSFTIVCALLWVCFAKSAAGAGEKVAEDQSDWFHFAVDCRGRLNPPLPENYFGNCVGIGEIELKHGELKGSDGFVKATKAIGAAIKETVYNDKGVLHGADKWLETLDQMMGKRIFGVAGSPRFDFYAVDFGWGRPEKVEELLIDWSGTISLCKSRDFEGGLEIGISKTVVQMNAFTTVFHEVLGDLLK